MSISNFFLPAVAPQIRETMINILIQLLL